MPAAGSAGAARGLWPAVHAHQAARQAGGAEAARDRALLPGPVDERGGQAGRRVGAEHAALGPGSCAGRTAPSPSRPGSTAVVEIDEVWHFVEKKSRKLWIWKAFERGTGRLIDWECGERDQATLERLLERLERWGVRLFCTDDWAPYDAALPAGRHYIGKDQTQREREQQRAPAALVRPLPPAHLRGLPLGRDGRRHHGAVRLLPLQRRRIQASVSRVKPSIHCHAGGRGRRQKEA